MKPKSSKANSKTKVFVDGEPIVTQIMKVEKTPSLMLRKNRRNEDKLLVAAKQLLIAMIQEL